MAYIPELPVDIGNPLVTGYALQSQATLQATEMQSGRIRTRERWRNVPQQVTLNFRLSDSQMQMFEGFLKYEIRNGAAPFRCKIRTPRSTQLETYVVQLTDDYSGPNWVENASPDNGYWDVSYTAITKKDIRTSEEEYINQILGLDVDTALALIADGINTHWLPDCPQNPYPEW